MFLTHIRHHNHAPIFSLGDENEPATVSYLSRYIVIAAIEIIATPILIRKGF